MSRVLGSLVVALACVPAAGSAQINIPAPHRQGFFLGGGLGYGATRLSCDICVTEGSRIGGMSGYLRAGYTVTPVLLLGAEFDAWGGRADPETAADTTVSRFMASFFAVGYWYPSTRMGLYLKAGAGLVSWRADGGTLTASAMGGTLGAGFEIPVGRRVSLLPFVNYLDTANGDLTLDGSRVLGPASISMWQVGIGATWN